MPSLPFGLLRGALVGYLRALKALTMSAVPLVSLTMFALRGSQVKTTDGHE